MCDDELACNSTLQAGETSPAKTQRPIVTDVQFKGSGIQHTGSGSFIVNGDIRFGPVKDPEALTKAALKNDLHRFNLEKQQRDNRERLLRSFKFPAMNERRQMISESFPETFKWIFEDEVSKDTQENDESTSEPDIICPSPQTDEMQWGSFSEWLRSNTQMYWITGKPGSGKSTLVKYLICSSKTKLGLGLWKGETALLSHFFWRPGIPEQRNIKGFLCSLLYQLFEANDSQLESVTYPFDEVVRKESCKDWSTNELAQVLAQVLYKFETPFCLFIDGLDEIDAEDDIAEHFEIVDLIKQSPSAKICISSRQEPHILKWLGVCPRLQVHNLTFSNLWKYAGGKLRLPFSYLESGQRKEYNDLLNCLVHKAEGVFLWLCLAIKSLNNGLDNGYYLEDALQRLKKLPLSLSCLYMDMWTRLNETHDVYHQSAARYLKFVLASLQAPWRSNRSDLVSRPCLLSYSSMTILEMAIATTNLEPKFEFNNLSMEKMGKCCKETKRLVLTRCAGLLEVVDCDRTSFNHGKKSLDPRRRLAYNAFKGIRFIHRSAFEFLTDTTEGAAILSNCTMSEQSLSINLFQACLLAQNVVPGLRSDFPPSVEDFAEELSEIWDFTDHREPFVWDAKLIESASYLDTLDFSGRLLHGGANTYISKTFGKDDFLVYAAEFRLSKYVRVALTKRETSAPFRSRILLAISVRVAKNLEVSLDDVKLMEELLLQGADPNYKGYALRFATLFEFASSFSVFIAAIYANGLNAVRNVNVRMLCHILHLFLEYNASLSDLVNINILFSRLGDVEIVSLQSAINSIDWENQKYALNDKASEKHFRSGTCGFLIPALMLFEPLVDKLDEALSKSRDAQDGCCDSNHIKMIRDRIRLVEITAKPCIVGALEDSYANATISIEESNQLSSAVVGLWRNPESEYHKAILRGINAHAYGICQHGPSTDDLICEDLAREAA